MRTRLIAYATFALVALGVTTVFIMRRARPPATPEPPPTRPPPAESDAATVTRVFGAVSVQRPDTAPYWLGAEDDVGRSATLEAAPDRPALVAVGANEIVLRAGARLRLWREGDATVAQLDQGEIFVDAGPAAVDVRCPFSAVLRGAAGSVLVTPQETQIAVSRGTVLCTSGPLSLEIAEGEVVEAREGRIGGSTDSDAGAAVAWARDALAKRNLHRDGPITVRPETRYRLRGESAQGRLAVRAGRETLGGWTLPGGRFAVDFSTGPATREITVEGLIAYALLLELGAD